MYLAIDIGGTKTFVASLDDSGVITERFRFATPKEYVIFKRELASYVDKLSTKEFTAAGVGAPGRLDRERGIGIAFGNLTSWHNVSIKKDVAHMASCPVVLHNDTKLAGLSEAMLLKDRYKVVLYVTVSTGIGAAVIVNQQIILPDLEAGHMMIEFNGTLQIWESFASGSAIVKRFGKLAREITDKRSWQDIAHTIALGLNHLVAMSQPEVIVLGGSVGVYLDRFKAPLEDELKRLATPMTPVPHIQSAQRPEDAVLYGCYDLARSTYAPTATAA